MKTLVNLFKAVWSGRDGFTGEGGAAEGQSAPRIRKTLFPQPHASDPRWVNISFGANLSRGKQFFIYSNTNFSSLYYLPVREAASGM